MASGFKGIHLSRNGMLALVTVVGIAAIGILVYFIVRGNDDEPAKKANPTGEAPVRPGPSPAQPSPGQHANNLDEDDNFPVPSEQQTALVREVARGFTTAWVQTGRTKDQWFNALKGYCSSGFASELSSVDPEDVPAESVTGDPQVNVSFGGATANVPVNSGVVSMRLVYFNGKWLINAYDFELRRP